MKSSMRWGRRLLLVLGGLPGAPSSVATPLAVHIHTEKAMFQVLISPGAVGMDSFVLQLMTGEGTPLPVKEAILVLSPPDQGVEPLRRSAKLGADGYWRVDDVALPSAGRWHMRIEATTLFKKVILEDDFEVPVQ